MMAPKGVVDGVTWQRISRSVDYFDDLYSLLAEDLNFKGDTESRFISIGNEVTEWRAQLRYSQFLLSKSAVDVFNIHGEVLNPELADIANVLSQKRNLYFKTHASGVKLENVNLTPLIVIEGCVNEDSSDDEE